MPPEILENIVKKIDTWNRTRVRATCKTLKQITDSVIRHEIISFMKMRGNKNELVYQQAVIEV